VLKNLPVFKVWQDSLRDHGWIEGKNLIVDYRSAEGRAERLSALVAELVTLKPDLLVGPGGDLNLRDGVCMTPGRPLVSPVTAGC
jgi:hypothetical protein